MKIATPHAPAFSLDLPSAKRAAEAADRLRQRSIGDDRHEVPLYSTADLATFRATLNTWQGDRGGYVTLPETLADAVEVALQDNSVMRRLATVERVTSASSGFPTCDDRSVEGEMTAQGGAFGTTDVVFGKLVLNPAPFDSQRVVVSHSWWEDALRGGNYAGTFLARILMERVARAQNRHFTVGVAPGPTGVVTGATLGVTAASATAIAGDELLTLTSLVDPSYLDSPSCGFMMSLATWLYARKLKDGQGEYLFPQSGRMPMIDNFRVFLNRHVPTIASGNRSVVFGDFSRYLIADLREWRIDQYHEAAGLADADRIGFQGVLRSDGGLLDPGSHPVVALQHP